MRTCPNCSAENEEFATSCAFCGYTLIDISEGEIKEDVMTAEEILKGVANGQANFEIYEKKFFERANAFAKEYNEKLGYGEESQPKVSKEQLKAGIILAVFGFAILFLIIGGILLFGATFLVQFLAIHSGGEHAGAILTGMNLIYGVVRLIGFAFVVCVFCLMFKRTKTKTTVYIRKCESCGGISPEKSATCQFCGASLIRESVTVEQARIVQLIRALFGQ